MSVNSVEKRRYYRKWILSVLFISFFISAYSLYTFWMHKDISVNLLTLLHRIDYQFFIVSIGCMFSAFYLRAYKSKYLIEKLRITNTPFLFKALSIGYMFNSILPLRLGEVIRAYIIGNELKVSKSVVFLTIIFERSIDVVIIVSLFMAFLLYNYIPALDNINYLSIVLTLFLLGFFGIFSTYLFAKPPELFKVIVYSMTAIFNDNIKNRVRFTIWSLIHGAGLLIENNQISLFKFILLSIFMWVLLISAIVFLMLSVGIINIGNLYYISLFSYLSLGVPSGPAYIGSFHTLLSNFLQGFNLVFQSEVIVLYIWCFLIIPGLLVGSYFVLNRNIKKGIVNSFFMPRLLTYSEDDHTFKNKLSREKDISNDLALFLERYFSGSKVADRINKYEALKTLQMIKVLNGGSNALTILAYLNGKKVIRKIVEKDHYQKLKDQYLWLKRYYNYKSIPKVINEYEDTDFYYYDQDYIDDYSPLFDVIHRIDDNDKLSLLDDLLGFIRLNIHVNPREAKSTDLINKYIKLKIIGKMYDSAEISSKLSKLLEYDYLIINGEKYNNHNIILNKITNDDEIINSLSVFTETELHGDLTIDNIIAKDNQFILLDPNNENIISDPLVDYAKLYQSLHSGYEFLCQCKKIDIKENVINYDNSISHAYKILFQHLNEFLKIHYDDSQRVKIIFHESVHFYRMLPYRALINPETVVVFYAIAVKLLNDFYNSTKNEELI